MEVELSETDVRFEEEVQREPHKLKGWLRYLDHKQVSSETGLQITMIYERAIRQLPGSYKLWHRYLTYRMRKLRGRNPLHFETEFRKTNLCFERALLLLHKMPDLWLLYMRLLRKQTDVTATRRGFDRALRALPVTQHGRVWPEYLRFVEDSVGGVVAERVYVRYLRLWPEKAEQFVDWCERTGQWAAAAEQLVRILDRTGQQNTTHWRRLADLVQSHPAECAERVDAEAVLRDGIQRAETSGELWVALGTLRIVRDGGMQRARDVFEEALSSVQSMRDFALVFDAYAEATAEAITATMEEAVRVADSSIADSSRRTLVDLQLLQLESLMDRRPFLASDVELRLTPNAVDAWLRRVDLCRERAEDPERPDDVRAAARLLVRETFENALAAVAPRKAHGGSAAELWLAYARSEADDVKTMRNVLDRAVAAPLGSVAELSDIYAAYAEAELAAGDAEAAQQILVRALAPPSTGNTNVDYSDESLPPSSRVFKSRKLWALLVDIQESTGAVDSARTSYERMLELKLASPQTIVNFSNLLEQLEYFEDSFRVFERGIALFGYPVAVELWNIYLRRFVSRYGGSRVERARDLFEQALEGCPSEYAKPLFVAYGSLEEEYGLARRALRVYERATRAVPPGNDRLEMFRYYAAKTKELLGLPAVRSVYERGIEDLGDAQALLLALDYATAERRLGEIDRARALFAYASQFADPQIENRLWEMWHEFEVEHGNEDTFKEMLRIKRSVQAKFGSDARFLAAIESDKRRQREEKKAAALKVANMSESTPANPDEVAIDQSDLF
ncbi:pre-mRNA-splicing factor syf1 [Coemansia sp. RSA 988]|nr:pre-mRNA-splicing factor syf1 [Coemansia sp. RSA 988]